MNCELCTQDGGSVLYRDAQLRVVLVNTEPAYPAFCRVIWHAHVKEMSDLTPDEQTHLFNWLIRTEQALRSVLNPDKINLASLGNMTPHLHRHVIPRFRDDAHFPAPIWAGVQRAGEMHGKADLCEALQAVLMR